MNNFFTYGTSNKYNCSCCKWEGSLPDFNEGDKTEKVLMYVVNCPNCKKKLGEWQPPIISFLLPDDILKQKEVFKNYYKSLLVIMMMNNTNEARVEALKIKSSIIQNEIVSEKKKERVPKPIQLKLFKE